MFGTSAMTPPSAYYPGSSSSMSFYPPPIVRFIRRGYHWGDTTPMRSEPNHIRH